MRKTALGCTILEGHDIADLPLVSENSEILEAELARKTTLATSTSDGLMSAADKVKLDNTSTQMADVVKLGATNRIVNKVKAVELKTDTRTTVLTYASGNLAKVEEKDGTTVVKTTTLNYDISNNLTSVVETAGGTKVTTTLGYSAGQLATVSKAVV